MKNKEVIKNSEYIGSSFDEFLQEHYTDTEIEIKNIKAKLIVEMLNARREKGLTQKKLEELTGIKQPTIAKIENGTTNPSLETILKLVTAVGKTLKVASF